MATKQWLLIPLFEQFIRESYSGKRLQPNGKKIKPQTVDNYTYALRALKDFEIKKQQSLRIRSVTGNNKRELMTEGRYWHKFYYNFTSFMYQNKGCFDNYTGSIIKIIRTFFNYLLKEKLLPIGDFHKRFYVVREELPIITLLPEQLQFLIKDKEFHDSLPTHLQKAKVIFILGCTVALRYSDLAIIRPKDLEKVGESLYLSVTAAKTDKPVRIKLPDYAITIINDFMKKRGPKKYILPAVSTSCFNLQIRQIAERAGWTNEVGKLRSKKGKKGEVFLNGSRKSYRFCDLLSSHTMRRTAITTMLMLGMPEHIVRKISGHAANSKAFYRYVNLVQSYLDQETDKVFGKLSQ